MTKKKNTTNKRGRPEKKFISQKSQIKREKPGRPKKHEIHDILPVIPEKKENKTKDAIIRILFSISFVVFCFSLYITQRNKAKNDEVQPQDSALQTGLQAQEIKENPNQIQNQNINFEIIKDFYTSIQSGNIQNIYQHIDSSLKQSSVFKTYFSKKRLERFINNIDNKSIQIQEISSDEAQIKYKIQYSVQNIPFSEEREASFVTKDNQQKIAKIMCLTAGCSTMPFFNPGKYF